MIRETLACPDLEPDARSAHDLPFRVALALVNGGTLMSPALVARSALAVLLSAPLSTTPAVVAPQHERPNAVPTAAVSAAAPVVDTVGAVRLLVDGDPTRDVTATRSIVAVWKEGERVTVEGKP